MTSEHLSRRTARIMLVSLFSKDYPMICESHGLSVLAGALEFKLKERISSLQVIDLYALDCEQNDKLLLNKISNFRPTIISISVPYGSFTYLKCIFPLIEKSIKNTECLIIFGGAIPTYNPNVIFQEIDRSAIVIRGEGDEAIVKIVQNWLDYKDFKKVDNVCYFENNEIIDNPKNLIPLENIPPPYRKHVRRLADRKAQIFVEASRGCSWAKCTFCPRGLLDVDGIHEYRVFPSERVITDLLELNKNGIHEITFSDEDFLGGNLSQWEEWIFSLEEFMNREKMQMHFDVSMTVRTIYSSHHSEEDKKRREDLLKRLKKMGLRKVFLGIESGSPTQIVRYNKNHTPLEAVNAIQIVRNLGIAIELGFIMFDPLCSIKEVEENVHYIKNNKLADSISSLGSGLELRIQIGSIYFTKLIDEEEKRGVRLFERNLDYNTLTYPSIYLNTDVAELVLIIREWNSDIRPLYYPLKSLSRYGTSGLLGDLDFAVKNLVSDIRITYLNWILDAVKCIQSNNDINDNVLKKSKRDIKNISKQVLIIFENAPSVILNIPAVSSLINNAKEYVKK